MILVNTTFEIVTEESAEYGEAAELGMESENVPYSFRDLVRLMEEFPMRGYGSPEWLEDEGHTDMRTGDCETRAIHFSHKNNPRLLKYWHKAIAASGRKF